MTLHERINLRGHFARPGAPMLAELSVRRAVFLANICTGRPAVELAGSPHRRQASPGALRRWRNHFLTLEAR